MSQSARQPRQTDDVRRGPVEWDRSSPPVKVLWGRVAALAVTIIAAYLIGRAAGPQGVPVEELGRAQTELAAARERITELETRLEETTSPENARPALPPDAQGADEAPEPQAQASLDANGAEGAPATGREPTEGPQALPAQAESVRTYVVEDGDSLNTIARDFYGDASLVGLIAEANNITARGQIRVGQKLELPPKP
ncbi:MAG: LysM peptidoglycan-binding domain-containing protein [Actinomycetota bacterium]|nr:LysM peptidoglycan-binding domain-containing protein [Actinomycetota bacterium]